MNEMNEWLVCVLLVSQPAPGDLRRHDPHPAIARFADRLVAVRITARVRGRRQTEQRAELATILDLSPAKHFVDKKPRTGPANRIELHETSNPFHVRVICVVPDLLST